MLQLTQCTEKYHCVWYGDCGLSEKGLHRTCVSNDPPKPINNATAEKLLYEKCPQYFQNTGIVSFSFSHLFLPLLQL